MSAVEVESFKTAIELLYSSKKLVEELSELVYAGRRAPDEIERREVQVVRVRADLEALTAALQRGQRRDYDTLSHLEPALDAALSEITGQLFTAEHLIGFLSSKGEEVGLNEKLRAIRVGAGLSQEQLGVRLGLTGGAVRHVEASRRGINFDRVEAWAAACGCRLHYRFMPSGGSVEFPWLDMGFFEERFEGDILVRLYRVLRTLRVPGHLLSELWNRIPMLESSVELGPPVKKV